MNNRIHLIFMGAFTYPTGMAGTKRVGNVISALKEYPHISTRVILQRQSSAFNPISGDHEGIPYETVMGDLFRARLLVALPVLVSRTKVSLKRAFLPGQKNIIYFYGPLFLESLWPLRYACRLGYKIVFDVIEDDALGKEVSYSPYQVLKSTLVGKISREIKSLSAGVIVISSYLEQKYKRLLGDKVPIHYMPVSVNCSVLSPTTPRSGLGTSMFYAGSYGKKDGLPVLLDAFDKLAGRFRNLSLILSGRGDKPAMDEIGRRIDKSPFKDRIVVKGYLDDRDYYNLLQDVDIPCMTRIDVPFAHAGFPFKLGEFLATGKPVVASKVSDVDQYLVHKWNAMVVEPGSPAEICEAVQFLLQNPESAAAIGMRGRTVAETFFNNSSQVRQLVTFLQTV